MTRQKAAPYACRFDTTTPEFKAVRRLFRERKADEGRAALREIIRACWKGERRRSVRGGP